MAAAAVGAVIAVIGIISDFMGAKGQARIQNAQNQATRVTNAANNQYRVAAAALQNYTRSEQNNRILRVAGENFNTLGQNMVRTMDESIRGKTAKRLQATENLASMTTMAAAAGVGGTTTEMLNSTYKRAIAFAEQADEEKLGYAIGDMSQQRMNQISNAVAAMDQGTSFAQTNSVVLADRHVNPLGYVVQGVQAVMPLVDMWQQNRAASAMSNSTSSTKTTTGFVSKSAPSPGGSGVKFI